jgi:hypothetical protein
VALSTVLDAVRAVLPELPLEVSLVLLSVLAQAASAEHANTSSAFFTFMMSLPW